MYQVSETDPSGDAQTMDTDTQKNSSNVLVVESQSSMDHQPQDVAVFGKGYNMSPLERIFLLCFWFMIGCAVLLTWNAFLTNSEYFKLGFQSENLKRFFEPSMCICSMVPLMIGNLVNVGYLYKFSEFFRITATKSVTVIGFIIVCFVAYTKVDEVLYFTIIMLLAFALNFCTPIKSAALMSMVGYFEPLCFTLFMAGQAFAGLFVSIVSIIIASVNLSASVSSSIYFGIALFEITVALVMYLFLVKSEMFKAAKRRFMNTSTVESEKTTKVPFKEILGSYLKIFKKSKIEVLSMYFNLLISLAVFPTVTIKVRSQHPNSSWGYYFISVHCFLIFNLGDFLGRYINRFITWPKYGTKTMLIFTCSRSLFLPLYLFCTRSDSATSLFPALFKNDFFPIFFMLLFSLSNGHLITVLFGSAFTHDTPRDKKAASHTMVLALGAGLASGAAISFLTLLL